MARSRPNPANSCATPDSSKGRPPAARTSRIPAARAGTPAPQVMAGRDAAPPGTGRNRRPQRPGGRRSRTSGAATPGNRSDDALRAVGLALASPGTLGSGTRASRGSTPHCWQPPNCRRCGTACSSSTSLSWAAWSADYLAMGEWESAEQELANYADGAAAGAACFGGGIQLLRGTRSCGRGGLNAPTRCSCLPSRPSGSTIPSSCSGSAHRWASTSRRGSATPPRPSGSSWTTRTQHPAAPAQRAPGQGVCGRGSGVRGPGRQGPCNHPHPGHHPEVSARTGMHLEFLAICWDLGRPLRHPAGAGRSPVTSKAGGRQQC